MGNSYGTLSKNDKLLVDMKSLEYFIGAKKLGESFIPVDPALGDAEYLANIREAIASNNIQMPALRGAGPGKLRRELERSYLTRIDISDYPVLQRELGKLQITSPGVPKR